MDVVCLFLSKSGFVLNSLFFTLSCDNKKTGLSLMIKVNWSVLDTFSK